MADQQRVHPVQDQGAPQNPTAPLVPRDSSRSEKGDPEDLHRPFRRNLPAKHLDPPKRRSCCCRCLCWTMCLIILQLVILGITAGILFLVFRPKLPKYSIDSLRITRFDISNDNYLQASFNVNITARNPNKKIGIYYESGSRLSAWYKGIKLCEGSLPKFYQGHRNTTLLNLALNGQTDDATNLLASLQEQRRTGSIPLNLRARVPVRIKLGKLKLMKWKFLVRCWLDVDSLAADNVIRIRSSSCKFRFRL